MAKLLLVIIFAIMLVGLVNACPLIIQRVAWGARPPSITTLPIFPPAHVVIHHTATPACNTQAACAAQVRAMQNHHMDGNGWTDIGWNWMIGSDGLVYEGRGWGRGFHTVGTNAESISIAFIGTFTSELPTAAAINAALSLIICGVDKGEIQKDYWIIGHRQAAVTDCPGQALSNQIQDWPRWTANP